MSQPAIPLTYLVDHIDMPEARRLFKINMRKTNQTGYPYYLNVYEIEMYAGN